MATATAEELAHVTAQARAAQVGHVVIIPAWVDPYQQRHKECGRQEIALCAQGLHVSHQHTQMSWPSCRGQFRPVLMQYMQS